MGSGQQPEEVQLDFAIPTLPLEAMEPAAVPPVIPEADYKKPESTLRAEMPKDILPLVEPGDRSRFQLNRSIFDNGIDKRRTAYDLDPPR